MTLDIETFKRAKEILANESVPQSDRYLQTEDGRWWHIDVNGQVKEYYPRNDQWRR
jgi:hypothetical protein